MDSVELLKTENGAQLKILSLTPQQIEGPFYPAEGLVAAGTDLTQLKNSDQIAQGKIIIIEGRVRDQFGNAVSGALVEIWQACHTGRYHHPADPNPAQLDPHFQYWGRSLTTGDGFYRFRTIIPGEYPAEEDWKRPPHIHFKISKENHTELITQLYFAGEALNADDQILGKLTAEQQNDVVKELKTKPGSDHPTAEFDIKIEKIKKIL